jgi:ABC-type polysaccharide/polyol phosphate transport system ATPase subunit
MLRDDLMRWLTPWRRRNEGDRPRKFEDFWAVKDVSVNVQPGESVGLIGRNGAGKSTLLKMLSRVTRPTKGSARIRGRVGSLLEVGTGFHAELTGRENILLSGSILGMTRREIRRKFDEIVAFAEVEKFIDTPVKRYSSGMTVRLGFAVAAHLNPEVLIVDEVLAVGDFGFMRKSSAKMGEITAEGRTVILVTHNLPVIETLTSRCLVMKNGELVSDGPTAEIVKAYRGQWLESDAQSEIPTKFMTDVANPKVFVENVRFLDENRQPVVSTQSGKPMLLSFDLVADADFRELLIHVCLCRDRVVVSGSNSRQMLEGLSLSAGQRVNVCIRYDSVILNHGKYTAVIYALPSHLSSAKACLSDYSAKTFMVEGPRNLTEGYAALDQSWTLTPKTQSDSSAA